VPTVAVGLILKLSWMNKFSYQGHYLLLLADWTELSLLQI
jgi:hypothetical protein